MDSLEGMVLAICIVTVVWVVILLVCREIVCWYFKINRIVKSVETIEQMGSGIAQICKQLEKTNTLLSEAKEARLATSSRQVSPFASPQPAKTVICPNCNRGTVLKDDPLLGNL